MVVVLIEFLLVWLAFGVTKKIEKRKTSTKAFLSATLIYQYFVNSPLLVTLIFESIACRTVAGEKYLLADLTTLCDDSKYNSYKYIGQGLAFFFWGVIIYLILFLKLKSHYNKVPDDI